MSDYNIPVSGGVNGLNVPLHGHIAVYNKEFPVIPNPEGEATGYVTKLGFTPEILQVKDPEVHDWARAEEKPTYTKAEVGLGNVDNTSDLNKPISTATQTALDGKVDKVPGKALSTNDYTDTDKAIVNGVTSALATKVDKIAGKGLSSNDYTDYEKTKLAYIQSGAEVNVQADWFEANRWSDAFILNKPTKLSDFSNDTGFITSTVDNLTYYYKKSETYTQAEVNALIGSIVTISFLVVQELPQTGEANIIYLVPADEPNPDNIYEEYIYVNDDWEMIGTTKVDLSNYYTKTETNTLLNGKVDKDGDKVLSDNNYSDTDKTKLDGIEAEANKTIVDTVISATSTNPLQNKAIYDLLNDLLPEAEETGNPISITNASGLNAKSLKVELEPIQDLHGYDSPWVGGGGKNKLQNTGSTQTINDVKFTVNSDGTVLVNGTASASTIFMVHGYQKLSDYGLVDGTQYTLSGTPAESISNNAYVMLGVQGSGTEWRDATGSGISFTPTSTDLEKNYRVVIMVASGTTVNNLVYKPMLRKATESSEFAPYSNICPISGRNSLDITVNSNTETITFPETVYGGTCDVVNGGTSNEWGYIASYNGETLSGEWLSDRDKYVSGTTPTIGAEVVYKKTPTTINTPSTSISLNKGNNTISTSGDNMDLKYTTTISNMTSLTMARPTLSLGSPTVAEPTVEEPTEE